MVIMNAVDDELIATNNEKLRLRFLSEIQQEFDVKDIGQGHWYLKTQLQQIYCFGSIKVYMPDMQ